MRKKLSILMILILVLAQLCACGKTQADPAPAAGSESAVPAARPDEPAAEAPAPEPADPHVPDRVLASRHYSAEIYETTIRQYRCSIESREYVVSDGVTARAFRATGIGGPSKFLDHTVQEGGTLHYFDAASGKWVETPLAEGKYASPVVVIELASGASYFLALPRTFVLHENDTKEYLPEMDGTLYVTKTPDGFHLTVNGYGLAEGRVTDCLILSAPFQLVDWSMQNCAMAWVTYVQNGASHWCFDGYYRKAPSNYIPTGTNYYYCCAASYCIKGFLSRMPMCKEAAALTIVMLDTSHISTEAGGWLIPDYWHPSEITAPHTSLNHQASECLALYHASDLFDREDLRALADRMLLAIEDTGSGWVMPDHNLYYSIKPDGTYVEGDYPYLTYNDLLYLRKYLTGFGKTENETLTYLMGEKLQWMQRHGVTGYEKS